MTVYVSKLFYNGPPSRRFGYRTYAKLFCEDLKELHEFAESLGLKSTHFRHIKNTLPHYHLSSSYRALSITRGAVELPDNEIQQIISKIVTNIGSNVRKIKSL